MQDGKLVLQFPYHPSYVDHVRLIAGAAWHPEVKSWEIPYSQPVVEQLRRVFPTLEFGDALRAQGASKAESLAEAAERRYLPRAKGVKITDFNFKTEPYWHQKVSFNFARALPCSGMFLDPRLGKTKVLVDLMTWRYRKKQVRRVFVVCPNTVTTVWPAEIAKHSGDDFCRCEVLEGSGTKKIRQCAQLVSDDFEGYIVVNYDALQGMFPALMEMQRQGSRLFDAMGLDESSKIKHATSKRSKFCWKLGQTVQLRNILTGTPITQSLEDIFSQYRFLDQSVFGAYSTAFRGQYLIMGGFEGRQIIGYRNIDEALRKIYSISIRFTADRCLDLPKIVPEVRTVRMDEVTSRKYRELEKECVAEFDGVQICTPMVMTKRMKCSQVTGGFVYEAGEDGRRVATHRTARAVKLEAIRELLEEVPGKKFIVWCNFSEELNLVRELLDSLGIQSVSVSGSVRVRGPGVAKSEACACGECRECRIRRFQGDPGVLGFIGQIATANMGIDLSAADLMVYYSNDENLENRLQTEQRAVKIGKKTSIMCVDVLAETSGGGKTVDYDKVEILTGKDRFATDVSKALMQRMVVRQVKDEGSKLGNKVSAADELVDDLEGSGAKISRKIKKAVRDAGGLVKNPAHVRSPRRDSDVILSEGEEF